MKQKIQKVVSEFVHFLSLGILSLSVLVLWSVATLLWIANNQCKSGKDDPILVYKNILIGYQCPKPEPEEAAYILPFVEEHGLVNREEFNL